MNILTQLADHARARTAAAIRQVPMGEMMQRAMALPKGEFALGRALAKPGVSFLC